MRRSAEEACARALQYGPTEGLDEVKACITEVMAAEDMRADPEDVLVTTGGQQVIDLVCRALLDPGDVGGSPRGPTYPGAVPSLCACPGRRAARSRWMPTACGSTSWRRRSSALAREGRQAEVHLHHPVLPEPRRRHHVARTLAGGSWRSPATVRSSCSRTTRTGSCATRASRFPTLRIARRRRATSSTSAPSRRSSPPGSGSAGRGAPRPVLDKLNLGKQGADLCSSTFGQHFVAAY